MSEIPRLLLFNPDTEVILAGFQKDSRFKVVAVLRDKARLNLSVARTKPDILLLDLGVVGPGDIRLVEQIAEMAPYCTILVMSAEIDLQAASLLMTAGADGLMVAGGNFGDLIQSVLTTHRRVSMRKQQWVEQNLELINPHRPRVVVVFSLKGGVGKTTLSVNLSVALVQVNHGQVVLLSLDGTGDAGTALDLQPTRTLTDYLRAIEFGGGEPITPYLTAHSSGIYVLAAPPDVQQAERVTGDHVKRIMSEARLLFDYVVVDTAPAFTDQTLAVLDEADHVVMIVTPEVTTTKNVRAALKLLQEFRYPVERILLVINRMDSRFGFSAGELERALGWGFAGVIPNDPEVVVNANNEGRPFVLEAPESKVARAILELAQRIIFGPEPTAPSKSGPLGIWNRLLRRKS